MSTLFPNHLYPGFPGLCVFEGVTHIFGQLAILRKERCYYLRKSRGCVSRCGCSGCVPCLGVRWALGSPVPSAAGAGGRAGNDPGGE